MTSFYLFWVRHVKMINKTGRFSKKTIGRGFHKVFLEFHDRNQPHNFFSFIPSWFCFHKNRRQRNKSEKTKINR